MLAVEWESEDELDELESESMSDMSWRGKKLMLRSGGDERSVVVVVVVVVRGWCFQCLTKTTKVRDEDRRCLGLKPG